MIYPTINELTKGEYNRYEIALATAKCARMITNEYTRQRVEAERQMTGNKETDKPLNTMIDKEVRDEKAVKLAIGRIHKGEYTIVHKDPAEQEREEQAILAGINPINCNELNIFIKLTHKILEIFYTYTPRVNVYYAITIYSFHICRI